MLIWLLCAICLACLSDGKEGMSGAAAVGRGTMCSRPLSSHTLLPAVSGFSQRGSA